LRPASSDGISENIVEVVTTTCSLLEWTLTANGIAVLLTTWLTYKRAQNELDTG